MDKTQYAKAVFSIPAQQTKNITIKKKLNLTELTSEQVENYKNGTLTFSGKKIIEISGKYYLCPEYIKVKGEGENCIKNIPVVFNNEVLVSQNT